MFKYISAALAILHKAPFFRSSAVLSIFGSLFFATQYIDNKNVRPLHAINILPASIHYLQQQESSKDMQQDDRMDYLNERLKEMRDIQTKTYQEGVEYTRITTSQLTEMLSRMSHDEGIASGLFIGIGILSTLGFINSRKEETRKSRRVEDED